MKRLHLLISGDVQGVGFRAWTKHFIAEHIPELTGWVRNREDGTVEVVAEGLQSDLIKLVAACKKGPDVGLVEHTDETWTKATGEFVSFDIRK